MNAAALAEVLGGNSRLKENIDKMALYLLFSGEEVTKNYVRLICNRVCCHFCRFMLGKVALVYVSESKRVSRLSLHVNMLVRRTYTLTIKQSQNMVSTPARQLACSFFLSIAKDNSNIYKKKSR